MNKILIIEDNPGDARTIKELLKDGHSSVYNVTVADSLDKTRRLADKTSYSVIILDLNLPDSSGFETLIKITEIMYDTPVIVLTDIKDEVLSRKIMQAGAEDCINKKGLIKDIFIHSVAHAVLRHETKKKLKKDETRFRTLAEKTSDGIIVIDKDGIIKYVNPATETIFARKREELCGFPFGFPFSNERVSEINIIKKGGSLATAELRVSEIYWDGELCYLAALRDITKHKHAEVSPVQQNEALAKLNDFAVELSMLTPAENPEAFITKRIKEISGAETALFSEYNPKQRTLTPIHIDMEPGLLGKIVKLLGKQMNKTHAAVNDEMYREITTEIIARKETLYEASFHAVSSPVAAAIQALLKADRFIGMAYLIDGILYGTSLLAMGKGKPDPPKNILTTFISLAAVSLQRRKAELALKENEEKFRNLVETTNDIIWETNSKGLFTYINPRVEDILGYKQEEMTGRSPFDFMPHDEAKKNKIRSNEIVASRRSYKDLVNIHLHKDGHVVIIETSGVPVIDAENNLLGYRGINRDITERKRAEDKIKQFNEIQTILNDILRLSLEDLPLEKTLKRILDKILTFPSLSIEKKGAIFLANEPENLVMTVQRGLSHYIVKECSRLPFGKCLCGRAALSQKIQFAGCLDVNHEVSYKGMTEHGHYCVPIIDSDKTLGVINLYLKKGHVQNQSEEEFLTAIADTLAGIIRRKQAEEKLLQHSEDIGLINLLNTTINRGEDIKDVISKISKEIMRIFGAFGTMTFFPDKDKKIMAPVDIQFNSPQAGILEKLVGGSINSLPIKIKIEGDGHIQDVIRSGLSTTFNDAGEIKSVLTGFTDNKTLQKLAPPVFGMFNMGSIVLIPLVSGNDIYGMFEIARTQPTTNEELKRMDIIAGQITLAIARKKSEDEIRELNISLEEKVDERTQQLSVLNKNLLYEIAEKSKIADTLEKSQAELQKQYDIVHKSEEKIRLLFDTIPDPVIIHNKDGKILQVNKSASLHLGYSEEELLQMTIPDFDTIGNADSIHAFVAKLGETKHEVIESSLMRKDKTVFPAEISARTIEFEGKPSVLGVVRDITERKQAENQQKLSSEILSLLNTPVPFADTIEGILSVIKEIVGLDAVGIRLKSGNDYPYIAQIGFSDDFFRMENTLIARNDLGICMDENGNPNLECTCGMVISGKTGSSNPPATEWGSIWTNNSTTILDIPVEEDDRFRPRNLCIHEGYNSIALIPIKVEGKITGLLQLNDRKKDCFTLAKIHFFEKITESIGVALKRKNAEELLNSSKLSLNEAQKIAKMGSWEWDIINNKMTWSENTFSLLCLKPLEIEPTLENIRSRVHPDDVFLIDKTINEIKKNRQPAEIETRIICPDGTEKWINNMIVPVFRNDELIMLKGVNIDISERKKYEQELIKSQVSLSNAQQIAHLGSWELDAVNNDLIWSDEVYRIFGVEPREFEATYETFLSFVHPDDREAVNEAYSGSVRDGKDAYEIEHRIVRRDNGEIRYVHEKCRHYRDTHGKIIRSVGMVHDITETKKSTEKLRKLSAAVEQSHATIVITNVEGNIEYVNTAFSETTGYSLREAVGINPRILKSGYHSKEFYRGLWDTITKFGKWEGEICNRKKNGELFWEAATISSIKNEKGEVTHYIAVKEDITSRKNIELELLKLSKSIESANVSLIITDHHGKIEYVNPYFQAHTGYFNYEILGKDPGILNSGYHPREYMQHLWNTITSGKVWHGEFCNRKKNGELFWDHSIISPIMDDQGKITHFVSVQTDITLLKTYQEELQKEKNRAEDANRLKSEFLANMSHEIRTPLNAIIGFSSVLMEKQTGDNIYAEYLGNIMQSGKVLLNLINDILDLSKIEAGRMVVDYQAVSFIMIIEEIKSIFRAKADEKGIYIHVSIAEDVPESIVTDEKYIRQVLFNLVGNAVKFTSDGGVDVSVNTVRHSVRDSIIDIIINVKDTGIGIDAEQHSAVFEPFVQAKRQDKNIYGGTGLGLSITKRLVELLGGTISLESEKGRGSLFTVVFKNVEIGALRINENDNSNYTTLIRFNDPVVMLAEDIQSNRKVIRAYLEPHNIKIVDAVNGKDCIAKARRKKPDLILMDIEMPVMDGITAIKTIRSDDSLRDIPVIVLSALGMKEQVDAIKDFADDYLIKPIYKNELLHMLTKFLPFEETAAAAFVDEKPAEGERTEPGQICLPDDVRLEFAERFSARLMKLQETVNIDELVEFERNLREFNNRFHLEEIDNYCNRLLKYTTTFDITNIAKVLKEINRLLV